jgi:hypothetical protein
MLRSSPSCAPFLLRFAVTCLLAACSTPATDAGFGFDVGPDIPDVKLSFGKQDVLVENEDAATQDAKPQDAVQADAPDAVLDAKADVAKDAVVVTDVPPTEDVQTVIDVQPDVPIEDVPMDTGPLPDIPGCKPKPEYCNGIDDNCDGQTDESCDDGEPCTVNDACAGLGNCVGTFKNCDDGDKCTADTCLGGNCDHPVYPCNDNNPCTADSCDPTTGCAHPPLTDACDDGNPCTTGDNCSTGGCAGTLDPCDDGNLCTTDSCSGGCQHANNTTACDDGNPCTPNDACSGGACVSGTGGACDDGNACTDDTCDAGNCGHVNNSGACSDGDGCTTGDACSGGSCVAGTPTNCDDGLACTTDACSGGACSHADTCPAGNKCDSITNACITAGCAFPTNACANGSQGRHGCDDARVIGRSVAKTSGGFKISDSTCGSNSIEYWSKCYNDADDHSYRIFLRKNEKITVSYSGYSDTWCGFSDTGSSVTNYWIIIQSTAGCGAPTSGSCPAKSSCGTKSSTAFIAPAEGWFLVVADGETWSGGEGLNYTLTVKLDPTTCQVAGCECP